MEKLQCKAYINGKWVEGHGETIPRTSPATGEIMGSVKACSREQLDEAVRSAKAAQQNWAEVPLMDRVEMLNRAFEITKEKGEDIARLITMEMGKSIREAREEVLVLANENFHHAAGDAMRFRGITMPNIQERTNNKRIHVTHMPVGVVGIITPWNFPVDVPNEMIAYALVIGNTVIWKPSEFAPFSAEKFMEVFDEAGFPPGVINLVHGAGSVGSQLVEHEDVRALSFTGSTGVGERIAKTAGIKKVLLELGGNGPQIVMADANIDAAADAAITGCFYLSGQCCTAAERILVHEDVHDEFVQKLLERTMKIRVSNPLDENTDMGPLYHQAGVDKTNRHVQDAVAKGARVVYGGTHEGLYYQPTIITGVTTDMEIAQEETFGPVAPIIKFRNREEALEIANGTKFGLTASVFTSNLEDSWYLADRLQHGTVHINESTNYWDLLAPFGGMKKSGLGRGLGIWMLEAFTETKQITFDISKGKKQ